MVGLDLQAQRQTEQDRSQKGLRKPSFPSLAFLLRQSLSVSEYHGGQDPRQEGQGLHLGVVADLYDLQVVGAEGNGHGTSDSQELVYPERKH